jgi:hypothetical protein
VETDPAHAPKNQGKLHAVHHLFTIHCATWANPEGRAPIKGNNAETPMIRKLKTGEYRLYSRKTDPKTGKRKNLGTFESRAAAEKHERAVQYFKRA